MPPQQIDVLKAMCKNRHPSPICTRFEHHFHALKPHLHRRSFSDTLPENQRHLIALKRHPLWHMQKLCQLSQPAELRSTFFRNRNAVLCQDVLQLSNPLALSLEFFLSCVKVFHRLTLHLVVAGPFQFLKPYIFPHRKDMGGHTSWPPPSRVAFKPLRSRIETRPSTRTS